MEMKKPSLYNWFILPFFGLFLIGSMGLVVLIAMNIEIQLLTIGYDKVVNSLNDSILWIANQEGFLLQNMRLSVYLLIAIYLLLGFVYWSLKFHKIKYLIGALASFLIIQLIVLFEQWENSKINQLWLLYQQNQNRPPRTQKTDALQSAKNYWARSIFDWFQKWISHRHPTNRSFQKHFYHKKITPFGFGRKGHLQHPPFWAIASFDIQWPQGQSGSCIDSHSSQNGVCWW